jgi:hypothetical protein
MVLSQPIYSLMHNLCSGLLCRELEAIFRSLAGACCRAQAQEDWDKERQRQVWSQFAIKWSIDSSSSPVSSLHTHLCRSFR